MHICTDKCDHVFKTVIKGMSGPRSYHVPSIAQEFGRVVPTKEEGEKNFLNAMKTVSKEMKKLKTENTKKMILVKLSKTLSRREILYLKTILVIKETEDLDIVTLLSSEVANLEDDDQRLSCLVDFLYDGEQKYVFKILFSCYEELLINQRRVLYGIVTKPRIKKFDQDIEENILNDILQADEEHMRLFLDVLLLFRESIKQFHDSYGTGTEIWKNDQ